MHRLRDIQLFSKLDDQYLDKIKSQTITRRYSKDAIVFHEGDESNHIFAVLEGIVKLYKTSPKGTQIQINRFEAASVLGEYACFEHVPFPATCEFVSERKIAMIPRDFMVKKLGNADFSL